MAEWVSGVVGPRTAADDLPLRSQYAEAHFRHQHTVTDSFNFLMINLRYIDYLV